MSGPRPTDEAPDAPAGVYIKTLKKRDGRSLWLYGRGPIEAPDEAPMPGDPGDLVVPPNPHLRFHPLRGEWVAYAGYRQNRTFLPPPEYNPLAPTVDPTNPTEVPAGAYDVAVFENRFPSLFEGAHDPPDEIVPTLPARGACEVVVFTQDSRASLGALPLDHLMVIVAAWADRYRALGAREDVLYVLPFENRGVEVGVTLHHPHGQIYAFPFVPPIAARELEQQRLYYAEHGRGLLQDYLAREVTDGRRILYEGDDAVAVLPACARYAYEIWVAPRRAAASIAELTLREQADFVRALKTALLKLDGLWGSPMPYILAMHQAPTDKIAHPEAHLHVEIYPAYRMRGRLKYLAGSEIGAGMFTADTLPEQKAAELRAVRVTL